MTHSEFYVRTLVRVTPEEYAGIEKLYNCVEMDKDEFCEQWVKLRNEPIIKELPKGIKQLQDECQSLRATIRKMQTAYDKANQESVIKFNSMAKTLQEHFENFARQMIITEDYDLRRYECIEQEFGVSFIIKTKLAEGIELTQEEKDYLIKNLK